MEKIIEKSLNYYMMKFFPWWINFEITKFKILSLRPFFVLDGILTVDLYWAEKKWNEFHDYDLPLNGDTVNLISLVDEKEEEEIKEKINYILPFIVGVNNSIVTLSGFKIKPYANICDIMSVNSLKEITNLVKVTKMNKSEEEKINMIISNIKSDIKKLNTELDVLDTNFHEIQDIMCK